MVSHGSSREEFVDGKSAENSRISFYVQYDTYI